MHHMVVPILFAEFGCKYGFTECPVACVEIKTGPIEAFDTESVQRFLGMVSLKLSLQIRDQFYVWCLQETCEL